ncbi:hypothetical protein Daesc_000089 [Daldinia eschscholtzii]|uniref:Uncharacterized protein n=1 Tax=Daldinia eschscholtzii TaxID=292717 RepID=A0AAX6MXR0_9PEZI
MSKLWPVTYVPTRPLNQESFEDLEKLEVGEYADAVVRAGTSSWNVHLRIMTEALARGSNEVVVNETPLLVYKALVWIYTNTLDFHESFKGSRAFNANYLLLDMASRLEMYTLMLACQEKMKEHLRKLVVMVQRLKCTGRTPVIDVGTLWGGICFAYDKGHHELKNMFVDFVSDTHLWVFDVPNFRTVATRIHGYNAAIFKLVKDRPELRTFTPIACGECGDSPFAIGGGSHYADIVKSEDGNLVAICYRCFITKRRANRPASNTVSRGTSGPIMTK